MALQRHPLALLDSLPAHGNLVEIRLGPRGRRTWCATPDLARQVLTDLRGLDRTGLVSTGVRTSMGNGLASAAHQDHRRQRLVMQPAFRHEHLPGYVAVMRRKSPRRWRPGTTATGSTWWRRCSPSPPRSPCGRCSPPTSTPPKPNACEARLRHLPARHLHPGLDPTRGPPLPTPGNRRYARAVATWRAQVSQLIETYRHIGADRGDLMSRLLAARDEEDQGLSDTELANQVAVLMLAGGKTTSAAITWSWHLLTTHPDILQAVQVETNAVAGGDVAGGDHLPKLDLTARVVREALRLYPPAWVLPRVCTRPVTLAGRTLPPGSMVVFTPYILHRRPDQYPDPARFDPARWLAPPRNTGPPCPALRRRPHPVHRRALRPSRGHPHPRLHGCPLDPVSRPGHHGLPGRPRILVPRAFPGPPVVSLRPRP